jgi:D-alanine-D-alanine ligase
MSVRNDDRSLPVLLLYNLDLTWPAQDIQSALGQVAELERGMREVGHPVATVPVHDTDLETPLSGYSPDEHVVLNWCEGVPGIPWSDALVAETLEALNYAYTGAPADVLAFCQDKYLVKCRLDEAGVPTPRWRLYPTPDCEGWDCFPAIVKPSRQHCSFGVTEESVVMTPAELRRRVAYVLQEFQEPALVEDFIDGREFHVSLWGNGTIQMLPPAEMDFAAFDDVRERLCTYDSKFDPSSRHLNEIGLLLPAPLTDAEYRSLEEISIATYRLAGCRDYARLDVRLRDGRFYVLDINPNADISSDATMAFAAQSAGFSFGAMGSRLVNLAALRHPVFSAPREN